MSTIDATTLRPAYLAPMLRAWSSGLYPSEAAVGLLIAHGRWLRRRDFLVRLVDAVDDGWGPRGAVLPMAAVDWEAVPDFVERVRASSSELRILELAASSGDQPWLTPRPGPGRSCSPGCWSSGSGCRQRAVRRRRPVGQGSAGRRPTGAEGSAEVDRQQLSALPAVIDVPTAAKALGLSRTAAYELIRTGEWPTPVFRLGRLIRIPTAPLLELLGLQQRATESTTTASKGTRNAG